MGQDLIIMDFNGTIVKADSYEDFVDGETQLFGDVIGGLEAISDRYRKVLVSRTPADLLEKRVERLGIGKYFERKMGSIRMDGAGSKEMKMMVVKNEKDAMYENVYFVGNDPEEISYFNRMRRENGSQKMYSIAVLRGDKKMEEYNRKAGALGIPKVRPNYVITSLRRLADIVSTSLY